MRKTSNPIEWLATIAVILLLAGAVSAENDLTDPYVIFAKHFDAIGGLELVRAESTSYVESQMSVSGLEGISKAWSKEPVFNRNEIDLKVLTQTTGDNGEYIWSVDPNGKLQVHKDEFLLERRELGLLTAKYDYLDPNSEVFDLTFKGVEDIDGVSYYVVMTTNTVNDDSSYTYINTSNYLIEKSIAYTPDSETHSVLSDYRDVNGILRSFKSVSTSLPTQQVVTMQVLKYETNIAIDPSMFEPPGETPKDFRFTEGNSVEDIPFDYEFAHIFLPVTVDCKERDWILDSGAGLSVVDSSFAVELGLKADGEMKAKGIGNMVNFSFVKLPGFTMQGLEFDEQTIGAMNLEELFQLAGFDAVGILGFDFMSRFVIKVDFAAKTMSLYDPDTWEYTGSGSMIDAPVKGSILSLPVTVDGKYTGMFRLDLGASGNSFHYPYAKENGLLGLDGVDGVSFGAGGELHGKDVQFETVEIGGYVVEKPIFDVPLDDTQGGFGDSELIGNIGNSLLKRFVLYLDYKNQRLYVEKGADFDTKFERSKSGLQVMYNKDDAFEVIHVASNSPAQKAGFEKSDVLVAVNDIPIERLDGLKAIHGLMRAEAGTKYKFTVNRDGKDKDLKLKLEDLYRN